MRAAARGVVSLLLLALATTGAGAQRRRRSHRAPPAQPAQAIKAAPLNRPAFDAQDYAITIDLPDSGSTIHGNVVLTVARAGSTDTLVLDLLDLHVSSVAVDGHASRFVQGASTISVPLPHARGHRTYRVAVDYGGAVTDGLIAHGTNGRWTYFGDNFPDRARHWIPSIDDPSDKATVTWRVRAPVTQTVVANGRLVAKRAMRDSAGDPRTEWEWRESRPISVYLMVIAAAPLVELDLGDTACGLAEQQRCVPQAVYTEPEDRGAAPGAFARAPEIVQFFAGMVGPFPYEKLAHVESSTRFGGMENASNIFYPDGAFRRGGVAEEVIAHETAHQWFGDAVTERTWAHLWLSEGFATYFAALWMRAAHGDSVFHADLAGMRSAVLDDSLVVTTRPVIDSAQTDYMALLDRNSYEKGGLVLQMLRAQVGEAAFFDALRDYYAAHRHSTVLTDDLRAAMERRSKQHLGWFFDQWLRRPGYPQLAVSWSYDAAAREVVLNMSQGTRFGLFQFPVTVAVIDSAGAAHRGSIDMPATANVTRTLRIPLASAPARVIVDPDVELLAAIVVTPPT